MTPVALADTLSRRYALLLIEHDLLYAAAMQAKATYERIDAQEKRTRAEIKEAAQARKDYPELLADADAVLCREFDDVLNPPQGESHAQDD
jgi:hypothetical protein